MAATITRGQTFNNREYITNVKLHNLVDLATWAITSQATGDLAYYDGTNWLRLPKGTDGDILTMVSGVPAWVTP